MANEGPTWGHTSLRASVDYSEADGSGEYYDGRFVKLSAHNTVELCDTAGEHMIGVLHGRPKQNAPAHVVVGGRIRMLCGGTFAIGDEIGTDANGKAVKVTGTNNFVIGRANEAGVANQYAEVLCNGVYKR